MDAKSLGLHLPHFLQEDGRVVLGAGARGFLSFFLSLKTAVSYVSAKIWPRKMMMQQQPV